MRNLLITLLVVLFSLSKLVAQNEITIDASFNSTLKSIDVTQQISYTNTSNKSLDVIYLQDWTNSYSEKDTPLAQRFAEEFKNTFHFANDEDRGFTDVEYIKNKTKELTFSRVENQVDIIKVTLNKKLQPNESINLDLKYAIQVQNDKFTRYGFTNNEEFHLRFWYIVPAVFDGKWQFFSNKDLDDQFVNPYNINLTTHFNQDYYPISELNKVSERISNGVKTTVFEGENILNSKFSLVKTKEFFNVETDFIPFNQI